MAASPSTDSVLARPIQWRLVGNDRSWHLRVWPGPNLPHAPRFLLIHGLGATPAYFQPLAACLSQFGMVYAPDLPGFGGTPRLPGKQSTAAVADALAGLCAEIGDEPYVIVGHSLGCQAAVCLAAGHPELARGLVLLEPSPDPTGGSLICQAVALAIDVPREPTRLMKLMLPPIVRAGPRYLLTAIRWMMQYRWKHDLPRVRTPTLVIRGECDPLVSQQWAKTVVRLVPGARLVEVPGAPHGVNFTDPGAIVDAMRDLLPGV